MLKLKKMTAVFVVVGMLFTGVLSVHAFSGANNVVLHSNLVLNSVRASFYANRNTGSTPLWGAEPNRHIKQSHVRLIQGNYDSGRVWSDEAKSTNDSEMKTAFTSRTKHLWHTTYTYYGWVYF